jgi:hypothetical protein
MSAGRDGFGGGANGQNYLVSGEAVVERRKKEAAQVVDRWRREWATLYATPGVRRLTDETPVDNLAVDSANSNLWRLARIGPEVPSPVTYPSREPYSSRCSPSQSALLPRVLISRQVHSLRRANLKLPSHGK